MARPGRVTRDVTPTIYEIGVDVTPEQWNELILKIGDWFAESRPTLKEPNVAARQTLEACLKGVKPSDPTEKWKGAENSSFATRVKIACRFDMESMSPIRNPSEKNRDRKQKEKEREKAKKKKKMDDPLIPDEIRKELAKSAKYGDDPRVHLSSEEHKHWQELHDEYITQFPELAGINAAAELESLCDLLVVARRHRMKILKGEKVSDFEQKANIEHIVNLKKALGIHPDQLAKRVAQQTGGTVGELVRRMEDMGNYVELREKFFTEELLLIYQAFMTPSPRDDMGGYQLDEVGLFGATMCRTCECARCGHRNMAGLSMEEIENYLVDREVLKLIKTPVDKLLEQAPDVITGLKANDIILDEVNTPDAEA